MVLLHRRDVRRQQDYSIANKIQLGVVEAPVFADRQWWAKLLRLLTVNSLSYFVKIKY